MLVCSEATRHDGMLAASRLRSPLCCLLFFLVRGVASKEQLAYFDFSEEEAWRCCLVWCSGILFLLVLEAIPVELMAMPSRVFCLDYCSFCLGVSCLFVCMLAMLVSGSADWQWRCPGSLACIFLLLSVCVFVVVGLFLIFLFS